MWVPTWYGVVLLICAAVLLAIEVKYYTHFVSGIIGAILVAFGLIWLFQGPHSIPPPFAIAVSIALAIIILFLGSLAMRASKEKHLTGVETLVGETGVCRTPLNPEGTVLVNGEYWQARSNHVIEAGQRVRVERVDKMTVWVTEA
jgi:membrane-bound serine protease (ClpP class)